MIPLTKLDYYDSLPFREKFYKNSRWSPIGRTGHKHIKNILKRSIGKDFNIVYSDICYKFKKNKYLPYRKEFIERLDNRRWNSYYLEEGIIKKKPRKSRKKKNENILIQENPSYFIYGDYNKLDKYPKVRDFLYYKFGSVLINNLFFDKIPIKYLNYICRSINTAFNKFYPKIFIDNILGYYILEKNNNEYITLYRGTKDFKRYHYEVIDQNRKYKREQKRKEKECREYLLYEIEYKRKVKNYEE